MTKNKKVPRIAWQGVSGTAAFNYIDEHAKNDDDVEVMMESWRRADTPTPANPAIATGDGHGCARN